MYGFKHQLVDLESFYTHCGTEKSKMFSDKYSEIIETHARHRLVELFLESWRQAKQPQRVIAHNTTIMALGRESCWKDAVYILGSMPKQMLG